MLVHLSDRPAVLACKRRCRSISAKLNSLATASAQIALGLEIFQALRGLGIGRAETLKSAPCFLEGRLRVWNGLVTSWPVRCQLLGIYPIALKEHARCCPVMRVELEGCLRCSQATFPILEGRLRIPGMSASIARGQFQLIDALPKDLQESLNLPTTLCASLKGGLWTSKFPPQALEKRLRLFGHLPGALYAAWQALASAKMSSTAYRRKFPTAWFAFPLLAICEEALLRWIAKANIASVERRYNTAAFLAKIAYWTALIASIGALVAKALNGDIRALLTAVGASASMSLCRAFTKGPSDELAETIAANCSLALRCLSHPLPWTPTYFAHVLGWNAATRVDKRHWVASEIWRGLLMAKNICFG